MGKLKRHDLDFKNEVIAMAQNSNKSVTSIARDLGIPANTIYDWLKKKKDRENPIIGEDMGPEAVKRLKKELDEVRLERDILKKVVAIFSKQPR